MTHALPFPETRYRRQFSLLFAPLMIIGISNAHATSGQAGPTIETFSGERFEENWSRMATSTERTRPWHQLKWLDLGGDTRLSLGSDLKWRSEYIDAPLLGVSDSEEDFYVLRRFMVHGDLRFSRNVRFFSQFSHHKSTGRKEDFPFDNNATDIQQAFLEITGGEETDGFGVRLGRQEIVLTPRFVTSRGALNQRGAFDGVRAWFSQGPWLVDGFATRAVVNKEGSFDDSPNDDERFDAVRLRYKFGAEQQWQAIGSWHRIHRDQTTMGPFTGRDDRTSWGLRIKGVSGAWDVDIEHHQQTGEFADRDIDAFGGGGDVGYTWRDAPWTPRLGIRWLYGSGDGDISDNEVNTFFGPRARPPCCEDALWFSPSNLVVLSPVIAFRPTSRIWLDFKLDFVRRIKAEDGIFAAGRIAFPDSFGRSGGDALSIAPGFHFAWSPVDEATIRSFFVYQSADGVLSDMGGSDSNFSTLSIHFKF